MVDERANTSAKSRWRRRSGLPAAAATLLFAAVGMLAGCGETGSGGNGTPLITSSSAANTPPKPIETNASAGTSGVPSGGYSYNEKHVEAFIAACEHAGGRAELCLCFVRNSEAKVPEAQFLREGAALYQKERVKAQALASVVEACVQSQGTEREREEHNANSRKALHEGEGEAKREDEEHGLPTPK